MRISQSTGALAPQFLFKLVVAVMLCWVGHLPVPESIAQELPDSIVAVEEDWELTIGEPDVNSTAPQVTCAISPHGDVTSLHATFEINHQSLPTFVAGGMQLQLWNGEWPLSTHKFPNPAVIQHDGETIRWTQALRLTNGQLVFEITNGASNTWDNFGGQGYLRSAVATDLDHLNAYDPAVSIQASGIGFAANRVQSLVLKRVRVITSDGQMTQFDINGVVNQHD